MRRLLLVIALIIPAPGVGSALSFSVSPLQSVGVGSLIGHPMLENAPLFASRFRGAIDTIGALQDGASLGVIALSISANLALVSQNLCGFPGETGCPAPRPVETLTIERDPSRASHLHVRFDGVHLLLSGELALILSAFGESAAATLVVSEQSSFLFTAGGEPVPSFINAEALALDGTLSFVSPSATVLHGMQFLHIVAVPEPSSAALLALGLLALARGRRRG